MMDMSIEMLERAAFACFSTKVEDTYKRLMFVKIASILRTQPNVTANKCFALLTRTFQVDRAVFDSALSALETPFKFVRIDRYRRGEGQAQRQVTHLTVIEGEPWSAWLEYVTVNYPELLVWLSE